MARKIVCPVPDDEPLVIAGNQPPSDRRAEPTCAAERYSEMRLHLKTFGDLLLERPSGTFRRVTPPSGLNRISQQDMQAAEAEVRLRRDLNLFAAVKVSDCLVAPIDSVSDALVRAVDLALAHRIPVLLLQRQVPIQSAARDRFRQYPNLTYTVFPTDEVDIDILATMHRTDVTYVVYRTVVQMKLVITRFMNRVPLRATHTG